MHGLCYQFIGLTPILFSFTSLVAIFAYSVLPFNLSSFLKWIWSLDQSNSPATLIIPLYKQVLPMRLTGIYTQNFLSMIHSPHMFMTNVFIQYKIWCIHGRHASLVPWYSLFESIIFLVIILFIEVELIVALNHTSLWLSLLQYLSCVCHIVLNFSTILPLNDIFIIFWSL